MTTVLDRRPGVDSPYAWRLAFLSMFCLGLGGGAIYLPVVALKEIAAEFGDRRAVPSTAYMLGFFAMGVGGVFMGWLADRTSPRVPLLIAGVSILIGGWLAASGDEWLLYVGYVIPLGFLGNSATFTPAMNNIQGWFERRRSTAVSIISVGPAVSGFTWPQIYRWLLPDYGWRQSLVIYGVTAGTLLFLCAFYVFAVFYLSINTESENFHSYAYIFSDIRIYMVEKSTIVRLSTGNEKFEILVKPDPALEYKLGKKTDISNIMISDEIYSDANKGTRSSTEKLMKHFKTTDQLEIAKHILTKGDLNMNTEQRRKMIEEKKKQIVQYINKNFVDPKTHMPHPISRINAALDEARVAIDPFKRLDDQIKDVMDPLRKILPLKSEILELTVTVPTQFSGQSFSVFKSTGEIKSEQWLSDGSLQVILSINAGMKSSFLDRIGTATKGSAQVSEK